MQSISSKSNLINDTDVKVFCSNTQCQVASEELTNLRQQVTDLKETLTSLENVIQIKDMQLINMQRDNERLSSELKKHQRHFRNIKRKLGKFLVKLIAILKCTELIPEQLDDERFFYQREKDYFNNEMQRQKTRNVSGASRLHRQRMEFEEARESLEEENRSLREELNEKAETTYNLCIKFLRMKYAKDTLRQKFDQLLKEHLHVMADTMEKLDEAREELNVIVSEKFQERLPLSKAKFLQVLQRNTRLVHENATLKVQIQHLTLNIEKLKASTQKPKMINVDAKIIAKLATQNKKPYAKEAAKCQSFELYENGTGNSSLLTKPSTSQTPVHYPGDMKLLSKLRVNNLKRYANAGTSDVQTETWGQRAERARSAPEIRLRSDSSTVAWAESLIDMRGTRTNT
ncbi:LOW QUALITY PROTEIN: uncharacterized protein LOC108625470 [Ceratina calcarata]|uniref:LOW QUALITY PROTEIN: uncharacterized protein LOC108625470 n=1 Tax=Ceratina calcarata TaxID=156304 RepID=A0AAJ7WBX3_9HYME|nr:LOW QUALITY PROTEIN: uncharacterized protein LOC108625470 [Ceratina calcarata]